MTYLNNKLALEEFAVFLRTKMNFYQGSIGPSRQKFTAVWGYREFWVTTGYEEGTVWHRMSEIN